MLWKHLESGVTYGLFVGMEDGSIPAALITHHLEQDNLLARLIFGDYFFCLRRISGRDYALRYFIQKSSISTQEIFSKSDPVDPLSN